jgi:hypothetical protein
VRTKIVPVFGLHHLDPLALAIWAMDDGAFAKPGFYFHTKGFTFLEVYKLARILHYNFCARVYCTEPFRYACYLHCCKFNAIVCFYR